MKGLGIPEVLSYGHSGKYNILIQNLLGISLGELFYRNGNKFCLKDICIFTIQILDRIEFIHSKNIIHRDIKTENFLIGNPDEYLIYIIDFGLSKKYKSSRTNKHIQYKKTKMFSGTEIFSSLNACKGFEQSRRDDLESLGYMIIFFLNGGNLPWRKLSGKTKSDKLKKICAMKNNVNFEELFKDMPREIIYYMNYCRELDFEQKPNYNYLRDLFKKILKSLGTNNDLHFSWIKDLSILKKCPVVESKIRSLTKEKRKETSKNRIFRKLKLSKELKKIIEIKKDDKIIKLNGISEKIGKNSTSLENPKINENIESMNFKEEHIIKEKNINKLDIKDNLNKNINVSNNNSNTIEHYFFPFNENHKINKELNFKRVFFPNKTEINNEFSAGNNIISHNITKIIKENELKPNYIKNYQNGENECLYFKINNNIHNLIFMIIFY